MLGWNQQKIMAFANITPLSRYKVKHDGLVKWNSEESLAVLTEVMSSQRLDETKLMFLMTLDGSPNGQFTCKVESEKKRSFWQICMWDKIRKQEALWFNLVEWDWRGALSKPEVKHPG